jgi:hypothetical protein
MDLKGYNLIIDALSERGIFPEVKPKLESLEVTTSFRFLEISLRQHFASEVMEALGLHRLLDGARTETVANSIPRLGLLAMTDTTLLFEDKSFRYPPKPVIDPK